MSEPRYYVTTVTGWPTMRSHGGGARVGLSAHVLDRDYNCEVVASYRSEDRVERGVRGRPVVGVRAALEAAEAHAARLNAAIDD